MTAPINILQDDRNVMSIWQRPADVCVIELPCGKYRVTKDIWEDGVIYIVEVERQRKNGKNVWAHLCDHAHRRRFSLALHFAQTKVWA